MKTVRTLTRNEVDTLLNWAADEGWNPGLDDAAAFYSTDPDGFIGAFVSESLAAGISVVRYGQNDGFLGLYICHPDFRAQGHGWRVWQAGMAYLEGRSIGLDGVVDQQDNYRRSGFDLAYRNIRFQGKPTLSDEPLPSSCQIRRLRSSDMDALLRLDHQVHGMNRQPLISAWLDPGIASRHSVVLTINDQIHGFGTLRQCRHQYKVGPLVVCVRGPSMIVQRTSIAKSMIGELLSQVDADEVILDVPEPNESAMELASQLGLVPVFETARMYRGRAPEIDVQSVYGVTTLELG